MENGTDSKRFCVGGGCLKKVLVIGASSELASKVLPVLVKDECMVGMHYGSNQASVECYECQADLKTLSKNM